MIVISDIHGNLPALEAVAEDIAARPAARVINLGDHLSGPLWPRETAEFLQNREDWIHILGNHDKNLFSLKFDELNASDAFTKPCLTEADLSWLKLQSPRHMLTSEIVAFHGAYDSDTTYLLETVEQGRTRPAHNEEILNRLPDYPWELILCGHTHIPREVQIPNGPLIVNPGSVGLQAYDDDSPRYHVIETGSPEARYAMVECADSGWQVKIIKVPYDYKKAAARAAKNNRPDWEVALLTGKMK